MEQWFCIQFYIFLLALIIVTLYELLTTIRVMNLLFILHEYSRAFTRLNPDGVICQHDGENILIEVHSVSEPGIPSMKGNAELDPRLGLTRDGGEVGAS